MPIEKRTGKDGSITYRARVRRRGARGASSSFPTMAQARAWLRKEEGEASDARAGILPRRTVRDAIKEYIARECPKHDGATWEKVRLEKFLRTASYVDRQLAAVTPDDIDKWAAGLAAAGLARYSVRREYGLIRSVFARAVRPWGWLRVSPFAGTRPPPDGTPRSQRVNDADAEKIAAALGWLGAAPQTASQYIAAAFLFSIQTAMRKGEVLALDRADLDREARTIRVRAIQLGARKSKPRTVPLSGASLALLDLLPAEGPLFPVASGTCDTLFRRARNSVGLRHIHFHDARREATTRLAKKVDVLTLSKITGHDDINVLNSVYYAPNMEEVAPMLD